MRRGHGRRPQRARPLPARKKCHGKQVTAASQFGVAIQAALCLISAPAAATAASLQRPRSLLQCKAAASKKIALVLRRDHCRRRAGVAGANLTSSGRAASAQTGPQNAARCEAWRSTMARKLMNHITLRIGGSCGSGCWAPISGNAAVACPVTNASHRLRARRCKCISVARTKVSGGPLVGLDHRCQPAFTPACELHDCTATSFHAQRPHASQRITLQHCPARQRTQR